MTPNRSRAPSDYRSIAELKQGSLDGKVPAGSTIEVAGFGHPEPASETAVAALVDFLLQHSLRLSTHSASTEVLRSGPAPSEYRVEQHRAMLEGGLRALCGTDFGTTIGTTGLELPPNGVSHCST
jgi:hypothetical protein